MNYAERYEQIIHKHIGKSDVCRIYALQRDILDLMFENALLQSKLGGSDEAA